MKLSRQRIFIKNLPETATETEIKSTFGEYGKVVSVEIKERKDANLANQSLFFAYINIEIDEHSLQKCFTDFTNESWCDQYVELQIAKESFLERLKREREESGIVNDAKSTPIPTVTPPQNGISPKKEPDSPQNGTKIAKTIVKKTVPESDSSSSDSSSEDEKPTVSVSLKKEPLSFTVKYEDEDQLDLVIKSNKYKKLGKNGLKIESVGKEPILIIENKKRKNGEVTASESKRVQGVQNMIKRFQQQKNAIKAALSSVDAPHKNVTVVKIGTNNKKPTKENDDYALFQSDDEEEKNYNFEVRPQFEGEKGQKLLELQSRYKNDQRFALNERFLEEETNEKMNYNDEEITIEAEKQKEYEILEQVLGKKMKPSSFNKNSKNDSYNPRGMLRYDPTLPDHSKYEIKPDKNATNLKRKRREKQEVAEAEPIPEVSKNVFYKVADNLKETLQETPGFSLLSQFGVHQEEENEAEEEVAKEIKKSKGPMERNPFRYDSSDDENDETEKATEKPAKKTDSKPSRLWSEPFFFKEDDYRLQEGFDFINRVASKKSEDFGQLRRNLKDIVKTKVRHIQRQNRPFKKKIGANRRKKMIRIKKAMRR